MLLRQCVCEKRQIYYGRSLSGAIQNWMRRGRWSVRDEAGYISREWTSNKLHTYLDGACPFTYLGVRASGTFHSTATMSIQRVIMACMGFGPCTVSIFPCPATATLAGQAVFFRSFSLLTLTLVYQHGLDSSTWKKIARLHYSGIQLGDLPIYLTWNFQNLS